MMAMTAVRKTFAEIVSGARHVPATLQGKICAMKMLIQEVNRITVILSYSVCIIFWQSARSLLLRMVFVMGLITMLTAPMMEETAAVKKTYVTAFLASTASVTLVARTCVNQFVTKR